MQRSDSEKIHETSPGDADPAGVCNKGTADRNTSEAISFEDEEIQQKREHGTLKAKEHQLTGLMNNLPGLAYRCSNKLGRPMEFTSAGCQAITGYSPGELSGEPPIFEDLIHPDDRQLARDKIENSIRKEESFFLEYRILDRQGKEHWVQEQGRAVEKESDEVAILEGFISDITERKSAENALVREQERLKLASDAAHFGVWDLDLIHNELIWDDWMFRLYGVDSEAFGGAYECWQAGVHPEDIERSTREVDQAIAGEKPFDTEFRVIHPDGTIRHLRAYATVSRDDQGKPVRMTGVNYDITELKSMQSRLAKQKELLELVINSVPLNIFWKNRDSIYTGCNSEFVKSAGKKSINDILGKRDLDLIWSSETQKYLDDDNEVLATGNPKLNYEENYTLPDGSKVWWRTNKIPLKDTKGEVFGLLAVSEDITDTRKAEEALQRERDRLDYIIEASRLGTWAWNIRENTAEFNEMWAKLLGYTMDELGPSSYELWKSLGHPDDVPEIEKLLQLCATGEMLDYSSEFRMRHKDGHWVWILDRGRVMTYDAEDQPLEMFGTHADITPLIQAETELRQSEAKFRSYVEQAPYGVFITDETGHYVDTNPAASQLTGYSQDELLTMSTRDMVPSDGREAGAAHFALVEKTGFSDGVLPYVRKDGTRRLWNVTAVRLNRERVLGFVQDVTEREQMEKQIRAAQKLEAVGQLAGGVAHDFNNLLMGIMGYTELCLFETAEENPIHEWLSEIMHEAQRSADIVRQLLAFSRKQTIKPRILNLNDAVENMLKMLRRLIGEDIDLLWRPGRSLAAIKIDPGQVDQILANLCVNARDAIGGVGKVTIGTANTALDGDYCTTHAEAREGDFVMLAISDSGSGMDAETQARVFEPFFTTKAEGEGTGLGLSTVYGIVKQNGGSINLYSEPGKGTIFRIYLPCCENTANDERAIKVSTPTPGGNETLLIVEDQQAICKTISMFLNPLGYTVYTAETPVRALEIMDEFGDEIDVLITDVVMPGMNGRELSEKLQTIKPELKVLYMSGYTSDVIVHRGILEEGVNFLSKPVTRSQLAKKLRDMLDGSTHQAT